MKHQNKMDAPRLFIKGTFFMPSFFISFVCLCLCAFCVLGTDAPPPAADKGPHIVLLKDGNNDLGKINGSEKKTILFRIKNTGDAPGEILKLIPTCYCITGTVDHVRLGPQEEQDVKVVLDSSLVNGVFKRGVWVETNDPVRPRFYLSVRGEVLPLFHGLPQKPEQFIVAEGATWTNRFTLGEAEPDLFVGRPIIDTDTNMLRATATVVTNSLEKMSFTVTLVVTALAPGRHSLLLSLPIEGRPNLSPMKLTFYTRVGLELKAVPSKLVLSPTDHPLTRSLRLPMTLPETHMDTHVLTWTPQREGVSVQVEHRPRNSYLTVKLTLSPEAVTKLLKEKDAQMTFHYPNYKSVSIEFVAQSDQPAGTEKTDKSM